MANHKHREMPDGGTDVDEAIVHELALLGDLLRRRSRAAHEPPSPSFVESLWERLVYEDGLELADDDTPRDPLRDDARDGK